MLADVLADQLVLGQAVQRRRQLADAVAEPRVAHRHVALVSCPAQIDPQGFVRKPATKAGRDRR
jgi:hypothetical protein